VWTNFHLSGDLFACDQLGRFDQAGAKEEFSMVRRVEKGVASTRCSLFRSVK
jgi:hypothetical protein